MTSHTGEGVLWSDLLRYADLHPGDLLGAFAGGAPAVVPIGALEWHGPHLPLGLDLIVAEAFSERLAEAVDGVLLPALVTPITTLPHATSLQISTEGFRVVMDDTLSGLARAGARTILVVSGHYAQGHEIELYEAALRAMEDVPGLRVFAAAPLEPLGEEKLLDHAARVETALLMAIRPELVRLDSLDSLEPKESAVLGEDPRGATAEEGEALMGRALDCWKAWMSDSSTPLARWYGARFDAYEPYVEKYFSTSWEDAITAWWNEKGN